jgi:hypothetical protein
MIITKEMDDVFKGYAAGEMTSDQNTSEGYDAVMSYDPNGYDEASISEDGNELDEDGNWPKPYDAWEPFKDYNDDDFAGMLSSLKDGAVRAFENAFTLVTTEDLIAELTRRGEMPNQSNIQAIDNIQPAESIEQENLFGNAEEPAGNEDYIRP